jgi:hypothetical protein
MKHADGHCHLCMPSLWVKARQNYSTVLIRFHMDESQLRIRKEERIDLNKLNVSGNFIKDVSHKYYK